MEREIKVEITKRRILRHGVPSKDKTGGFFFQITNLKIRKINLKRRASNSKRITFKQVK